MADPLHIAKLRARDLKGELELELARPYIEAPRVFRLISETFAEIADWLDRYELLAIEPLFTPSLLVLGALVDKLEQHLKTTKAETYTDWMTSNLEKMRAILTEELGVPTAGPVALKEFKL